MAKDYYQILGIAKNATSEQINKVFCQLAISYRNLVNTEEAGEKFYEINEAYGVLNDENKRKHYDRLLNFSNYQHRTIIIEKFSHA